MDAHADDRLDAERLDRYFAGTASAAERREVEAYLAAHPALREALARLRARWRVLAETRPLDEEWATLGGRLGLHEAEPPAPSERAHRVGEGIRKRPGRSPRTAARPSRVAPPGAGDRGRSRIWRRVIALAACVAAAVLAWEYWAYVTPDAGSTYVADRGQRLSVRLPDGSAVILNAESRLTVLAGYGRSTRDVSLEGEAMFTVQPDARRQFRVRTAAGLVEDLGTVFAVRQYGGEPRARVVVAEGRVRIGSDTELGQNDLAFLDSASVVEVSRGVLADRYLAWTEGRLRFDDTPFATAIADVARAFDLDVDSIPAELAVRRVTVEFESESSTLVLRTVCEVVAARCTMIDRVVTITPVQAPTSAVSPHSPSATTRLQEDTVS